MTIPVFLEVAISLIFIYLILSLLAAEIQELIATILQWRAAHLKQSIEILLGGTPDASQTQVVSHSRQHQITQNFADQLYQHELIKSLNQQAQGFTRLFRWLIHLMGRAYRWVTGTKNTFNQGNHQWSGPSYLPADAFAGSLIQVLKLGEIAHFLTLDKLADFNEKHIAAIRKQLRKSAVNHLENLDTLDSRVQEYAESLGQVLKHLRYQNITLTEAIDEIEIHYHSLIEDVRFYQNLPVETSDNLINWLRGFTQIFQGDKKTGLLNSLKPSLVEVIQSLQKDSDFFKQFNQLIEKHNIQVDEFDLDQFNQQLNEIPESLKTSLKQLAQKVQSDRKGIQQEIEQLQQAVETWFNQSMERAAGVYKRNAKGVAILIGLAIAWGSNADTFNMVSSLYHSSDARSILLKNAAETLTTTSDANHLKNSINPEIQKSLENLLLPIGWHPANAKRQQQKFWTIPGLNWQIPYPNLPQFLGWLISAIAISMGSAFWFDLLKKVMGVRNTGQSLSSTENQNQSPSKL